MKYANFRPEYIIGASISNIDATDATPAYYVLCLYIKDQAPVMLTYSNVEERDEDYKKVQEIINEPLH